MPNVATKIAAHNAKIAKKDLPEAIKCNCHNKAECILDNNCNYSNVVYEAEILTEKPYEKSKYFGLTAGPIKERIAKHMYDAKTLERRNATKLTERLGELMDREEKFNIKWKIVKKAASRKANSKHCNLCLVEKMEISVVRNLRTHMNSRDEMGDNC